MSDEIDSVRYRMPCPKCKNAVTMVTNTKTSETEIVRYRTCESCGYRLKTIERRLKDWIQNNG